MSIGIEMLTPTTEPKTRIRRILVVDKNPDQLVVFCSSLFMAGFNSLGAYDGRHALALLNAEDGDTFDLLLIVEGNLEDNEWNLVHSARRIHQDLPVVLVASSQTASDFQNQGAEDVVILQKPICLEQLEQTMDQIFWSETT